MLVVLFVSLSVLLCGNVQAQGSVKDKVRALADAGSQVQPFSSDLELKLMTLNQAIVEAPQNPELQLKKGVYLLELGRSEQAAEVFEALRQEYPNHPAPYINLAAVYARQGRLEEARQMLIKSEALASGRYQTQLSLATVNMGLALAALRKANELNVGDAVTERKIREIEQLVAKVGASPFSSDAAAGTTGSPSAAEKAELPEGVAHKPRSPARASTAATAPQRGDRLRLSAQTLRDAPAMPASTLASTAATTAPMVPAAAQAPVLAPALARPATQDPEDARIEILNTVESWASAWSMRDHRVFISYYSPNFKAPNGMGPEAWGTHKQAIIDKTRFINVDVKIRQILVSRDFAQVIFTQRYRSDVYSDVTRKELKLALEGGHWKIIAENPL